MIFDRISPEYGASRMLLFAGGDTTMVTIRRGVISRKATATPRVPALTKKQERELEKIRKALRRRIRDIRDSERITEDDLAVRVG